jgi:hypothetical protein
VNRLIGGLRLPKENPPRDRRPHHTEEDMTMCRGTLNPVNQEVAS